MSFDKLRHKTAAFTMFAAKVTNEQRIPFEIVADPFYSEANMRRLRESIAAVESGEASPKEHELIEAMLHRAIRLGSICFSLLAMLNLFNKGVRKRHEQRMVRA